MKFKNTKDQYGGIAKTLHWLIAVLIIGLIILGAYMVTLDYYTDEWYDSSLLLHKALGMIVMVLVVFKTVWMFENIKPDGLQSLKPWEKIASTVAHQALFVLMVLMPVTGYIVSTSSGAGISIFDVFEVPAFFKISPSIRDIAITVHFYLAYGGAALIFIHIAAAFKHHIINKDKTLRRML